MKIFFLPITSSAREVKLSRIKQNFFKKKQTLSKIYRSPYSTYPVELAGQLYTIAGSTPYVCVLYNAHLHFCSDTAPGAVWFVIRVDFTTTSFCKGKQEGRGGEGEMDGKRYALLSNCNPLK